MGQGFYSQLSQIMHHQLRKERAYLQHQFKKQGSFSNYNDPKPYGSGQTTTIQLNGGNSNNDGVKLIKIRNFQALFDQEGSGSKPTSEAYPVYHQFVGDNDSQMEASEDESEEEQPISPRDAYRY